MHCQKLADTVSGALRFSKKRYSFTEQTTWPGSFVHENHHQDLRLLKVPISLMSSNQVGSRESDLPLSVISWYHSWARMFCSVTDQWEAVVSLAALGSNSTRMSVKCASLNSVLNKPSSWQVWCDWSHIGQLRRAQRFTNRTRKILWQEKETRSWNNYHCLASINSVLECGLSGVMELLMKGCRGTFFIISLQCVYRESLYDSDKDWNRIGKSLVDNDKD